MEDDELDIDQVINPPPMFTPPKIQHNLLDPFSDNSSLGNHSHQNHGDNYNLPNPDNILPTISPLNNPNDILNFHSNNLNNDIPIMGLNKVNPSSFHAQNLNPSLSSGMNSQSINPQNLKLPPFQSVNPQNLNLNPQSLNLNPQKFTPTQFGQGGLGGQGLGGGSGGLNPNSFNNNPSPFNPFGNNPSINPIKTERPMNPTMPSIHNNPNQPNRFPPQTFNPSNIGMQGMSNPSPNRFNIPSINPQGGQQNLSFQNMIGQNPMMGQNRFQMGNPQNNMGQNPILQNNIKLNMFNQNPMGNSPNNMGFHMRPNQPMMSPNSSNNNALPSIFMGNQPQFNRNYSMGQFGTPKREDYEEHRIQTRSQRKKSQGINTTPSPQPNPYQRNQIGGFSNSPLQTTPIKKEPKPEPSDDNDVSGLTEEKCYKIIEKLVKNPNSWPFRTPVNPEEWGITDYFDVIEEPMDLGTVSDKLSQTDMMSRTGPYVDLVNLVKDVRLIWKNCKIYNKQNSEIWLLADSMEREFETLLSVATGKPPPPPKRVGGGGGGRGRGRPKKVESEVPETISGAELDELLGTDESDDSEEGAEKPVEIESGFTSSGKRRIDEIYTHREIKEPVEGGPKFEYYIKWKMFSHLHCQWIPENEIAYAKIQLRNYWKKIEEKKSLGIEEEEEEFFDERFIQVDRFLAQKKELIKNEDGTTAEKTSYLVKWCGLPYTDSTWELSDNINDDEKLQEFLKNNEPKPQGSEVRPPPSAWKRLAECPAFKDGNKLRTYQLEGLNWMIFNWYQRRGSILADEMGLGKTVQTVGFVEYLRKYENNGGPYLVVCPLSTLGHWEREFKGWTEMNVITYNGSGKNRAVIREYEWYTTSKTLKFDILLTTYEMIIANDWEEIRKINWKVVIVDEAQRMKSIKSIFRQNMMNLKCDHRLLLTGTPIQNNTTELWALLNFISPWSFPILEHFVSLFGELKTSEQVKQLHTLLRPYLLRRMKEDVEKSIPPKEETIVEVEMTILQKQYYRAILEKNKMFLTKGCDKNNVPNLLNVSMQLRKVCNHPFLLKGVEEKQTSHLSDQQDYMNDFIASSGKFVLLDKLLPKLKEGGHKVLIFSQMVKVLDLIASYLEFKRYGFERIDGRIRGNDRQSAIDRFCSEKYDRFVFLLCTRAGGVGINLAAADTVIIFDSDWNPQNDLQAQARAHRIGQKNEVQIYRLITRNTYERQMFERSSKKLGLDQAVLSDFGSNAINTKLNAEEIDKLLKYGAYDLFRDEEEQNNLSKKFQDSTIDQILQKSAKKINYTQNEQKNNNNQTESTFAKATFQISSAENAIDINAENFWDLVMGESKTAAVLLTELEEEMCFKNKKTLQTFWKHLRTIVTDAINSWNSGRFEDIPADLHILVELVSKIKDDLRFSSDQRKKASGWYESLNNTGRKGRRRRGAQMDPTDTKPSKKNKNVLNMSDQLDGDFLDDWKKNDKTNFINALVSMGTKCLEDIKTIAKIDKTFEEMKSFALGFLFICEKNSGAEKDKQIFRKQRSYLEGKQKTTEDDVEDSLREPQIYQTILSNLKVYSKKLRLVERLNELVDRYPGQKWLDLKIPVLEESLTNWWTEAEDKDLLLGSLIHGVGNFEQISSDMNLCFHLENHSLIRQKNQQFPTGVLSVVISIDDKEHSCENQINEQTSKSSSYWKSDVPQLRNLNTRVKMVLDAIDLAEGKKKPVKKIKVEPWVKKDQTNFTNALLANGKGKWENIIQAANLSKTVEEVSEYCDEFLRVCERIVQKKKDTSQDKTNSKVKIDEKSITVSHAQKVLDRVALFDTIRTTMVNNEDLESLLSTQATNAGMPSWWKVGKDDCLLLKIIAEHGIHASSFESDLNSEECGFYTDLVKQETLEEKQDLEDVSYVTTSPENIESRKKFLSLFLQDKTPLIVRLSYLCALVTQPSTVKEDYPDSFLSTSCNVEFSSSKPTETVSETNPEDMDDEK